MGERIKVTANKPLSTKENSASNKQKTGFRSQSSHVDQILFLQRTIGNQAVQRLIKSGALQAKLRIGQPGDKYEQEADRVAEQVMRMPEPQVQRQVEPEEEEEEEEEMLQTKPLVDQITPLVQRQVEEEEEEEMLQTKNREDATSKVFHGLESQINAIKGGGQPLAESDRAYFEPRFGVDFSQVRVHTDTRAAESARGLNARAYTVGQDVVFGAGQYAPEATGEKKLLAHELTHVVQQRGGLQGKFTIGQSNDIYDHEADQIVLAVMRREHQVTLKRKETGLTNRQTEKEEPMQAKIKDALISRQVDVEEEEEPIQANSMDERVKPFVQKESIQRKEITIPRLQSTITGTLIKIQCNNNGEEESELTTGTAEAIRSGEIIDPWGRTEETRSEGRSSGIIDHWAPRQVSWRMGYDEVFVTSRGRGRGGERTPSGSARMRAGEDVLLVNYLRMEPEGGGDVVVFSGSNPLVSSGAIIGPQNHPANVGGRVSGQVYYTNMQRMVIDASVTGGVRGDEATIERLMRARVPEALRTAQSEADVETILLTQGRQELSERVERRGGRNPATLDSIDVRFGQSGVDHILPAIHYGVIDRDKIIDGMIVISADRVESSVSTQRTGQEGAMIRGRRAQTVTIEQSRSSSVTQTVTNSVAGGVEGAVRNALTTGFTQTDRDRARWQATGSHQLTGRTEINIGADAPIGIGTLLSGLGLIGRLGRRITRLIGLNINLDLSLNVQGETSGTIGAELSYENERIHETVRTQTSQIVSEARAHRDWRSEIQTAVTNSESQTGSVSQTGEVTGERTRAAGQTITRVNTQVRYVNPQPQLRILTPRPREEGTTGGNP